MKNYNYFTELKTVHYNYYKYVYDMQYIFYIILFGTIIILLYPEWLNNNV